MFICDFNYRVSDEFFKCIIFSWLLQMLGWLHYRLVFELITAFLLFVPVSEYVNKIIITYT